MRSDGGLSLLGGGERCTSLPPPGDLDRVEAGGRLKIGRRCVGRVAVERGSGLESDGRVVKESRTIICGTSRIFPE